MIGLYIPLPTPLCYGVRPAVTTCTRCWSCHNEPLIIYSDRTIGYSCADENERGAYRRFLHSVTTVVYAPNILPPDVREWFASNPVDLSSTEAAAKLLYDMGDVPSESIKWLNVCPRPPALGSIGERIDAVLDCTGVYEQPETEWGQRFRIEFMCGSTPVHWTTGIGGLDAQPGGRYNVRMTIKSFETWGGQQITTVSRVSERKDDDSK